MKNTGITVYGCERDEAEAFRSLSPRFGVVPALISAALSETNALASPRNQCVSVSHKSQVSEPLIRALGRAGVKYISTRSIGCNHIDTDAAGRMGIAVGSTAYSPDGVADYTLMLMLMALRNAKSLVRSVEKNDYRLAARRGRELRDLRVGVLGAGRIGRAVIKRLRGFESRVLVYDLCREADHVSFDELLRESDILTLHLPLDAATRHIIGPEELGRMKRDALIINTGRGGLVDTAALTRALEQGKLGGAALDVLEGEEGIFYFDWAQKPIEHQFLLKLQEMPNVLLTPHTAYYTGHALRDTVETTIRNCLDFERSLEHGQN